MTTTDRTVLGRLADLDPSRVEGGTSPEEAETTLQWVLAHDRTEQPQATEVRFGRRKILVGVAAAAALAVLGSVTLPSVLGESAVPPAAAIPMLEYSQPDGAEAATNLQQLAEQLRDSSPAETGRYFFEHRRYVGYSMHEVEVSEGYWEVDRLEPREDDSYSWFDTTDFSGGRLYVHDGEARGSVIPAGEAYGGHIEVPATPQALYDLVMRNNDQHQRYPGHYLIDAYNLQANLLGHEDRATFLEAIALADGVSSYGQVTDRKGRDGVAFGASRFGENEEGQSVEIETIMILHPTTGKVLETDTIYPNDLPGAPAVVEEYDLVVESRYTDTLPPCGNETCPGATTNG
ncbi:hypothetical protein GCM10023169_22180 [Georgenia halophila]|uniref:Uncharacterized protein n=1 Tax=Georgenia halophila TaxID=620889 RepID=A0ABP8L8P7_9MICO